MSDKHQAELDKFSQGGKFRSLGQNRVSHVGKVVVLRVEYKGGAVGSFEAAKEGACTVQVQMTDIMKSQACCAIL